MDETHWTFLQGTESGVREFANVLAVKYKQISPMDFSHSNIISVFNPKGELVHQQEGLGVDNKETVIKIIETATKMSCWDVYIRCITFFMIKSLVLEKRTFSKKKIQKLLFIQYFYPSLMREYFSIYR